MGVVLILPACDAIPNFGAASIDKEGFLSSASLLSSSAGQHLRLVPIIPASSGTGLSTARLPVYNPPAETLPSLDPPPSAPSIQASSSSSPMPFSRRNARSRLFSASTFRAATCISAVASTPSCSHFRNLSSSSLRYSFRRARERRWLSRMRARFALLEGGVCVVDEGLPG